MSCGAGASTWIVPVALGSVGEAQALALPAAPTGAAATCDAPTTAKTVTITWNAVTYASTYSVYDSTTSATGTYTLVASGISTNSYTSGTLRKKNYWFEVTAAVGTNWVSAMSSATGESTISNSSPYCVQP
jgi:hypothetical protein